MDLNRYVISIPKVFAIGLFYFFQHIITFINGILTFWDRVITSFNLDISFFVDGNTLFSGKFNVIWALPFSNVFLRSSKYLYNKTMLLVCYSFHLVTKVPIVEVKVSEIRTDLR